MKKDKFLKELEKKLKVLAIEEQKDILDEYRDIIEQKVEHGKTEEEAVEDFGDLNELSKEILSAYKINPDYNKDEPISESAQKLGKDFDTFIKKCANKVAEFSKDLVDDIKNNNQDINLEFIFELILKGFATFILICIASIPFTIIRSIGINIFDIAVFPFDRIVGVIWNLLVGVLFLGCSFLIVVAMFKQYVGKGNINSKKENTSKNTNKKNVSNAKDDKNNKNEEKIERPVKVKKEGPSSASLVVIVLLKVMVVIMLLPLIFFNIGLLITFIAGIIFAIKGLFLIGPMTLLFGMMIFFGYLLQSIFRLIFTKKKIYLAPFIISIIIGIIGGILTFDYITGFTYIDEEPKHNFEKTSDFYTFNVTSDSVWIEQNSYYEDIDMNHIIDNTLSDNEVKVEVIYYKEILKGRVDEYTLNDSVDGFEYGCAPEEKYDLNTKQCMLLTEEAQIKNIDYISIDYDNYSSFTKQEKKVYEIIFKNFKNQKIYDYDRLYDVEVNIATNEETKNIINNFKEN